MIPKHLLALGSRERPCGEQAQEGSGGPAGGDTPGREPATINSGREPGTTGRGPAVRGVHLEIDSHLRCLSVNHRANAIQTGSRFHQDYIASFVWEGFQ